jgi:hypothetical protein
MNAMKNSLGHGMVTFAQPVAFPPGLPSLIRAFTGLNAVGGERRCS